jgi:hypothetical protein
LDTNPIDERAAFIAALLDLACFLEAHPEAPVGSAYDDKVILHVFPDGDTDDERRAAVDSTALVLGQVAAESRPGSGHYMFNLRFGPVTYSVLTIDKETADLDEPKRPALVSVACEHCDGTGYCTRPGCETCKDWQDATEQPECGACSASAVRLVEKSAA